MLQASGVLSVWGQAEGCPAKWFEPRETEDLCTCGDTRRDRGWSCAFMRRARRMAENEAGVELRRNVRGRALLRRTQDNSRMSEGGPLQALLQQLRWLLSPEVSGSRVATAGHVVDWQGSRSCGCGRSRVEVDGAGSGAGTHRPVESSSASCCRERNLSSGR